MLHDVLAFYTAEYSQPWMLLLTRYTRRSRLGGAPVAVLVVQSTEDAIGR